MILTTLIGVGSCEQKEFFKLTNPPENPWLNISEFERAAVSPYNYAFCSDWGGAYFMNYRVILDAMTDLVYRIPGASANWPVDEVYNRQTTVEADRGISAYNAAYNTIGICNSALDFYYNNNENPYPDALPEEKEYNLKRIIGELHFMRAYSYYNLLVYHAPVISDPEYKTKKVLPLRLNFTDADAALNPVYATAEELYSTVETDLLKAKELLPESFIAGKHHPSYQYGRVNRFVANAILARLYFRLGKFDEAIEELNIVIDQNGGRFNLNQDPIEAFNRNDGQKGDEVIWYALYYDVQKGTIPKEATMFTYLDYRATNGGHGADHRRSTWHTYSMSNDAAKRIGWMDNNLNVTPQALRDKRYKQLYWRLEGYCGAAGCGSPEAYDMQYTLNLNPRIWGDKYYRGADGRFTNVPVIRLSEMYLTRSILRYRNGDLIGAANDLNAVRKRAWDAGVAGNSYEASSDFVSAANISDEMIHNERIRELAFEGDWLIYRENLGLPILAGDRENTAPVNSPYQSLQWVIPQAELNFKTD
ncbi:MAG: RagB/SusD family nutrient uptake outer membrane protein [Bacteroidales bacterium]|nr:RagB/SusD family nutrient uptake outer membrane protein [Bacteroidales bacterium]